MTIFQAVVLGIIQGLTEFLPVSSSGHLVISQYLFNVREPELLFDISVHVGTLVAVVFFYRKDILAIFDSVFRFVLLCAKGEASIDDYHKYPDVKLALLIVIGSVPTAMLGLLFKDYAELMFSSILLVGCALLVTGTVLLATRWCGEKGRSDFSVPKSLVIGFVQGLAIIPGISRSGSTIVAGLFLGLDRETAAKYSFLLSIPAIVGAEILSIASAPAQAFDAAMLAGTFSACVVGYAALKCLVYLVKKGHLYYFTPYCWLVGIFSIILGFA